MTPKLLFWGWAWLNLLGVAGSAALSWRAIRRGDVAAHRRWIHIAAALIGLFVVAYVVKVVFLGREGVGQWPLWDQVVLRVHELFVAAMLIAGGAARWWARRYPWRRYPWRNGPRKQDPPKLDTGSPEQPDDREPGQLDDWRLDDWHEVRQRHRKWGQVALIACVLVLLTGLMILVGMWMRAA